MTGERTIILARYGEIALKGLNFPRFVRQLQKNVGRALRVRGVEARVYRFERRIYVETDQVEPALDAMTHVFGLTSISPSLRVPADIEAIKEASLRELLRSGLTRQHSFRVQARRADKRFPMISPEINREVGGHIADATGARVDLSDAADFTIGIEIQHDHALLFARILPAAGGMPVPLSGPVVALISVGLDSPVAAWMMMKRGCGIIPLHMAGSEESERRFLALCDVLRGYSQGWRMKPVVMSHHELMAPVVERLRASRDERWACLFCKRTMIRAALDVAKRFGAHGVVLGDSLGQVASQTLENMRIISDGADLPIYRPLIGMDKVEVMAMARRIGTYPISTEPSSGCPYLPEHPLTMGNYQKFLDLREAIEGVA